MGTALFLAGDLRIIISCFRKHSGYIPQSERDKGFKEVFFTHCWKVYPAFELFPGEEKGEKKKFLTFPLFVLKKKGA